MPVFHFDVRYNYDLWSGDETGVELSGSDEARSEALDLIAGLAKDKLRDHDNITVRIRDGDPEPILTLTLSLRAEERA